MVQLIHAKAASRLVSREELIDRARSLQPLLAGNSAQGDKNRRVPDGSIKAVLDAELFNVWVPRRYGGLQTDLRTQVDVLAALAEGDASVAWIGSLYTGTTMTVARFTDQAQVEIWGDGPSVPICGGLTPLGTATPVEGGYRVSGSWPWQSGSHYAKWVLLPSPVIEDSRMTAVIYTIVHASELTLKDTWYTLGMRGTGSNTYVAEDVFVPAHRVLPLLDETGAMNPPQLSSLGDEGLYSIPVGVMVSTWMLGIPLGIARATLKEALAQIPKRSLSYTTYTSQRESVSTQMAIATAASMIDEAYFLTCRACAAGDSVIEGGPALDMLTRARSRGDCGRAIRLLREAVDLIIQTCGASSMGDHNMLQRHFRDMSTVTLHALNVPDIQAENYGRALLGLEPAITMC